VAVHLQRAWTNELHACTGLIENTAVADEIAQRAL
jgi:hypothetical protein